MVIRLLRQIAEQPLITGRIRMEARRYLRRLAEAGNPIPEAAGLGDEADDED
jgi:hypothetical protein